MGRRDSERAAHNPILAHARKAKLIMEHINMTDKLDAKGLALLLRNGTLPKVWIPLGRYHQARDPFDRALFLDPYFLTRVGGQNKDEHGTAASGTEKPSSYKKFALFISSWT